MEDNQHFDSSKLTDFASNLADESRKLIRELFVLFKETAFPKAKQDTLDYQTVCLIEDEFRKQEKDCIDVIDNSFKEFCENSSLWLNRFKRSLNSYTKIALVISETFIIDVRGHHFTYFIDPIKIPTRLAEKFFEEATLRNIELLQRQDKRTERLSSIFRKVNQKLKQDRSDIENKFQKAIENLIEIELPASHKRIEAIINQNYLQRTGAIHGMN